MQDDHENKFITDLLGEDVLGVVLRAHNYIEALLARLLDALVPSPEYLMKLNLDYSEKVDLSVAMGLGLEYACPLKALGSIRNKFAHRLDAVLFKDDTKNLYEGFCSDDKNVVQSTFERTKKQIAPEKTVKFKHLGPKDQFVLLVVTLRAMLLAAVLEAEEVRDSV
jgi:hypothetical protein